MNTLVRPVAVLSLVLAALVATGCEDTTASPAQREAIGRTVTAYLEALAKSYSTLDVKPLEGWAAQVEVENVRRNLKSLVTTGDRLDATLRSYEIESIAMFREINATVGTMEVWDIVRYDAFTGKEKGRIDGSVQKAILQLRQVDGRWQVIGRKNLEGEPTPTPGPRENG